MKHAIREHRARELRQEALSRGFLSVFPMLCVTTMSLRRRLRTISANNPGPAPKHPTGNASLILLGTGRSCAPSQTASGAPILCCEVVHRDQPAPFATCRRLPLMTLCWAARHEQVALLTRCASPEPRSVPALTSPHTGCPEKVEEGRRCAPRGYSMIPLFYFGLTTTWRNGSSPSLAVTTR